MEIIPSEMLRGHIDTIILLSLIDDDKHTNQIREEIEARSDGKFELKQGTFYSCLQRIVKQGYVTEYRSTSSDGVRRKFYQLTEKGKTYIDENKDKWEFSRAVINELIKTPEKDKPAEKTKKVAAAKPEVSTESFDIDKALRDFMNSEDAPATKPEKVPEEAPVSVAASPELEELDIMADKATIIDLADFVAKNNAEKPKSNTEVVAKQPVAYAVSENTSKPTIHAEKSISPEEYDILTLMGADVALDTSNVNLKPTDPDYVSPIATFSKPEESEVDEKVAATAQQVYTDPAPAPDVNPQKASLYEENDEEDDYYNGESTITHDYKSVLQKLFPSKPKETPPEEEPREMVYVSGTDINSYFEQKPTSQEENTATEAPKIEEEIIRPAVTSAQRQHRKPTKQEIIEPSSQTENGYDFSDIKSLAKIEGFKVSFSTNSVKRNVNSILLNKLNVITSLIFYLIALVEIAVLAYFTGPVAQLEVNVFIIAAAILAILPITTLLIYFINPSKKVASIPTLKSIIETCIVVMLNLVVIVIVFSILSSVDYSNNAQLLRYVLYPAVAILNIPIYFIIKYLNLENPKFYK